MRWIVAEPMSIPVGKMGLLNLVSHETRSNV